MTNPRAIISVLVLLSVLVGVSHADAVKYRQGGGGIYTDLTFDQTDIDTTNDNVGSATSFATGASAPKYTLLGCNGLLAALPLASGDQINWATLTIVAYQGDNDTVTVSRCLTNWMPNLAGTNQSNVTGQHAVLDAGTPWSSGTFSTADYDAAGGVSITWDSSCYGDSYTYDVTAMVKAMYDNTENYGFVISAASGTGVYLYSNNNSNEARRPILTISYSPGAPPTYALTVNSGTGGGSYVPGAVVGIYSDVPPFAKIFYQWTGDTGYLGNPSAPDTAVTMPAAAVEVTATYTDAPTYTLTINSGSGSGDYVEGEEVEISADPGPSGYLFEQWVGDVAYLDNPNSPDTTVTMPAMPVTATATLALGTGRLLTVNDGSGGGMYLPGVDANISADPAPSGYKFNMWVGELGAFADRFSANTYFTMPDADTEVTATYCYTSVYTDWWPAFNYFCKTMFGAEKEPLAYDMFGSTLAFVGTGEWRHVSETSACVAFETNLPTNAYIEYGQTTSYGQQTDPDDGNYYMHIQYLRDLLPDTTYHYRYVATDERANTICSADKTLTTATPSNVVYVPGGLSGPPYNLTQSGRTYLLTEDIDADGTGIEVKADNVVLDLGGHTLTYNNTVQTDPTGPRGDFWDFMEFACMGIRVYNRTNVDVVNGTIKQGPGNNGAENCGMGYSPFFVYSSDGDVAGLTVEYTGRQVTGIDTKWSGVNDIHHNVVLDRGGRVYNRHSPLHGIDSAKYVHHNLLKRVRHCGISGGSNVDVYSNEMYIDSCDTNSFGVNFYASTNSECNDNKIFGTGYLAIGVGTVSSGVADIDVHDNFMHLEEMEPDTRSSEYGPQSGGYCCRITWGGDNIDYHDNVLVTYARDGGMVRGTWFYTQAGIVDIFCRNNIIKAILRNEASDIQGAIVVPGDGNQTAPPHVYENNRVISNFCNVRFGESYGTGANTRFYDNTFVKEGPTRSDYRTIQCGSENPLTTNHELYDSSFEGGASYDAVLFAGAQAANNNFYVGWTLTIETEPLADITIEDVGDVVVYSDQADGSGIAQAKILQYRHKQAGKTFYTPHEVMVTKGEGSGSAIVTVDAKKTVSIPLEYALTVTSGSGSGDYEKDEVVPISADPAPSGKVFDQWIGDTDCVASTTSGSTTVTMPDADVDITATYTDALYTLTVNSGSGSGNYAEAQVVPISADPAPTDMVFKEWIGDTDCVASATSGSTTVTMPASSVEVTATYKDLYYKGDRNHDFFVGQTDLDIVLDMWGKSGDDIIDERADVNDDDFIGQTDLDYVLDDWGKSGSPP